MRTHSLTKAALIAAAMFAPSFVHFAVAQDSKPERSVSQGLGRTIVANMFECPGGSLVRPAGFGMVVSSDGMTWTVPAAHEFQKGPRAPDLYNECAKVTPASLSDVRVDDVPIVTVDSDGEVITGYLIADNYFELYINGKLVGVDSIPFTPFNSSIVRFKAKRPITYAIKLIDWEEHLGLGTERGRTPYHAGDAGFLARFSDGTITDSTWKAQSFYIAPLTSPDQVVEKGNVRDTPTLKRTYPDALNSVQCENRCFAVHYPQPKDWNAKAFDDKNWPAASEFTLEEMGTPRLKAYTNFRDAFGNAKVIWSNNLVFDNVVLARKVVR
jgi:hypothetical protein